MTGYQKKEIAGFQRADLAELSTSLRLPRVVYSVAWIYLPTFLPRFSAQRRMNTPTAGVLS